MDLDHRGMRPPHLRVVDEEEFHPGFTAYTWDFRVAQPNAAQVAMPTVHSVEHFLGCYFRDRKRESNGRGRGVVNVAPMGCQTGFYVVAVNIGAFDEMAGLIADALNGILSATDVPLADEVRCGWGENHSLVGAQRLAAHLLSRRAEWADLGPDAVEVE